MAVFTDITGGNNIPRLQQVELTNPIQSNVPVGLDLSAVNNAINTIAGAQDRQLRKQELAFNQKVQERAFAKQNYEMSKEFIKDYAGNIAGSKGDGSNAASSLGLLTEYKSGANMINAMNKLAQERLGAISADGTFDMQKATEIMKSQIGFDLNDQVVTVSGAHKMVRKFNDNVAKFQGKDTGVIDVNKYAEINSQIGNILNKDTLDYNDLEKIKALTSENVFIKDPDGKFETAITDFETKLNSTYGIKSVDDGIKAYTVNVPTLSSQEIVKQFTDYWTGTPTNRSIAEHYGWLVNGQPTSEMIEYATNTATNYLTNAAADNVIKSAAIDQNLARVKEQEQRKTEQYKAALEGKGTGSQTGYTRIPGINYEINSGSYDVINKAGLIPELNTASKAIDEQLETMGKASIEDLTVGEYNDLLEELTINVNDANQRDAIEAALKSMKTLPSDFSKESDNGLNTDPEVKTQSSTISETNPLNQILNPTTTEIQSEVIDNNSVNPDNTDSNTKVDILDSLPEVIKLDNDIVAQDETIQNIKDERKDKFGVKRGLQNPLKDETVRLKQAEKKKSDLIKEKDRIKRKATGDIKRLKDFRNNISELSVDSPVNIQTNRGDLEVRMADDGEILFILKGGRRGSTIEKVAKSSQDIADFLSKNNINLPDAPAQSRLPVDIPAVDGTGTSGLPTGGLNVPDAPAQSRLPVDIPAVDGTGTSGLPTGGLNVPDAPAQSRLPVDIPAVDGTGTSGLPTGGLNVPDAPAQSRLPVDIPAVDGTGTSGLPTGGLNVPDAPAQSRLPVDIPAVDGTGTSGLPTGGLNVPDAPAQSRLPVDIPAVDGTGTSGLPTGGLNVPDAPAQSRLPVDIPAVDGTGTSGLPTGGLNVPDAPAIANVDSTDQNFEPLDKVVSVLGELEGTIIHSGVDSSNITLPYGIVPVPDSLTYKGEKLTEDKIARLNDAQKLEIDTSKAVYKTLGEQVNRGDYDAGESGDKEFTKAILKIHKDNAVNKINNFTDLPKGVQSAIIDMSWNSGPKSLSWSGIKNFINELNKPKSDIDYVEALKGITKHSITTSYRELNKKTDEVETVRYALKGLAKRRALEFNMAVPESEKISWVNQKTDSEGKVSFEFLDSNYNIKYTRVTSYKPDKQSPDGMIAVKNSK